MKYYKQVTRLSKLCCILSALNGTIHAQDLYIKGIHNSRLIPFRDGELWGYSDVSGKIRIAPAYDSVTLWCDEMPLTPVFKNHQKSFIDTKGKLVLPFLSDSVYYLKNMQIFSVHQTAGYGLYSALQKEFITPAVYDRIDYLSDSLFLLQKEGRYSVADMRGKPVTAETYDTVYTGNVLTEYKGNPNKVIAKSKYAFLLIDATQHTVTAIDAPQLPETPLPIAGTDDRFTSKDRPVHQEGIRSAFSLDSVTAGPLPCRTRYTYNRPFHKIHKGGKAGAWQEGSNSIVKPAYDDITEVIELSSQEAAFVAKQGQLYGIIDKNGKALAPFQYDSIPYTDFRYAVTCKNGKKGIVTFNNKVVISNKYDEVATGHQLLEDGPDVLYFLLYPVVVDGKRGYVGQNGVEYFR